jgi:hypothetical protein
VHRFQYIPTGCLLFLLKEGGRFGYGEPATQIEQESAFTCISHLVLHRIAASGSSNFNAMEVMANHRFVVGLQFGAAWTWSKVMDLTDRA